MASNEVSDRTLRRLRLTLAKRIAEGCEPESSQYHKRRCGLPVQESDRSNCLDHHLSFNEREVEMTDTETESDCSDLDEGSINSGATSQPGSEVINCHANPYRLPQR